MHWKENLHILTEEYLIAVLGGKEDIFDSASESLRNFLLSIKSDIASLGNAEYREEFIKNCSFNLNQKFDNIRKTKYLIEETV